MKFKKGEKCLCYGVICTIVDIDDNIAVLKSKAFDDGDGHDEVTFSLNELKKLESLAKISKIMKEITEDYVSWETARLLKEKGFDEKTSHVYYYYEEDDGWTFEQLLPHEKFDKDKMIHCPTSALAMKWLRKVHNINIEVFYFGDGDPVRWSFEIIRLPIGLTVFGEYNERSYENACEAAIKYVLENLI